MKERLDIEFKKHRSSFKRDSRIKECFHYDKESCSDNIIQAHSVQRSGVLNLLEEEFEGNKSVFSFLDIKFNQGGMPIGFEPLGKKVASTFYGFCGFHDNKVFEPIENNAVDLDNDEHCFLLSYRAFAKDYHAKQETLQGFKTNELYQKPEMETIRDGLIEGSELGLRDCLLVKNRLNEILKNKEFDTLEYLTYELPYMIPMALSASFNPDYSIKNELLNKTSDPSIAYEHVNFIIQPTNDDRTLIVLSCLPEQKKSSKFIDQLNGLKDLPLEKAISSIVIAYIENTFIAPSIWLNMSDQEQNQLLKELMITTPASRSLFDRFFHSKLNLLDKKYKKNATQQSLSKHAP